MQENKTGFTPPATDPECPDVHLCEFIPLYPDDETLALKRAIDACRERKAARLVLEGREYRFRRGTAIERLFAISNHDSGTQAVAFNLVGFRNFIVEGNGARLVFEGEIIPFALEDGSDLTVRNLTIDWAHPLYFQATLLEADAGSILLEADPAVHCDVRAGRLFFSERALTQQQVRNWKQPYYQNLPDRMWERELGWQVWYDPATGAMAYDSINRRIPAICETTGKHHRTEQVGDRLYRIHGHIPEKLPLPGWVMADKGSNNRRNPAMRIWGCQRVLIAGVTIHHCGGMGVIAEFCEDITLVGLQVLPSPGSGRMVSTTADATHFVSCRGTVKVEDCRMESMLDDGINVHGNYLRAVKLIDPHTVLLGRYHTQQAWFAFARAGDALTISLQKNLEAVGQAVAREVEPLNATTLIVHVDSDLSKVWSEGLVFSNASWEPDVVFRNNVVRNNMARGVLATTSGRVLVEGNVFERQSMSAVLIESDAVHYHESGPVRDMLIRGNTFSDYAVQMIGEALLKISPRIAPQTRSAPFHWNIRFEENDVSSFNGLFLNAFSAKDVSFCGNRIRCSSTHPKVPGPPFLARECEDVVVEPNQLEGFQAQSLATQQSQPDQ